MSPESEVPAFTLSGSTLTGYSPYSLTYTALGGDSQYHFYGLPLTNTASVPTPQQIGSFAEPTICTGFHLGLGNALQPTSAYFIVQYAASGGSCNAPTSALIKWSDIGTTNAPTTIPILNTDAATLYTFPSGALYGEVAVDISSNLNFYPAASGTPNYSMPTMVLAGAGSLTHYPIQLTRTGGIVSSTVLFDILSTNTGGGYIYRFDTSGSIVRVYTAASGHSLLPTGAWDDTNFYFADTSTSSGMSTYTFYKVPLAGGTPSAIGTQTVAQGGGGYAIIDSDGSYLIVEFSNSITPESFALYSYSVTGSASQTPNTLVTFNSISANGMTAFLDYQSDHLFVNEYAIGTVGGLPATTITSLVVSPSTGSVLQGPTANSLFYPWVTQLVGAPSGDSVFQLTGLPTTFPNEGGAALFSVNASSLTATAITTGGSPYALPSNTELEYLVPVATSVAIGDQLSTSIPAGAAVGLLLNASGSQLQTISVAGTDVLAY